MENNVLTLKRDPKHSEHFSTDLKKMWPPLRQLGVSFSGSPVPGQNGEQFNKWQSC
jgi:hypothetical protein